jgi:YesN/AraC family two-component response regulator
MNIKEKINVLIVDDAEQVRQALKSFISLVDDIVIVGEAVNGREGVDKALELEPDIIIMDENMPVLNGLEASSMIKKSKSTSKIIMLTNYEEFESEAYKRGIVAYILKGTKLSILINCIRKVAQGDTDLVYV